MLTSEVWELFCCKGTKRFSVVLFRFNMEETPVRMWVKFVFHDLYAVFSQCQERWKVLMAGFFYGVRSCNGLIHWHGGCCFFGVFFVTDNVRESSWRFCALLVQEIARILILQLRAISFSYYAIIGNFFCHNPSLIDLCI